MASAVQKKHKNAQGGTEESFQTAAQYSGALIYRTSAPVRTSIFGVPKTNVRQNFFVNRMTESWNKLPPEVVMAPSVNCFKERYDCDWKGHQYETDPEMVCQPNIQVMIALYLNDDDDDDDRAVNFV